MQTARKRVEDSLQTINAGLSKALEWLKDARVEASLSGDEAVDTAFTKAQKKVSRLNELETSSLADSNALDEAILNLGNKDSDGAAIIQQSAA